MKLKNEIHKVFESKAFNQPLFYNYPGALRFELSIDGTGIEQFTTAHRKAMEICNSIFSSTSKITVCFKIYGRESVFSVLKEFRVLNKLEIFPDVEKEYWCEIIESDDFDGGSYFHNIIYQLPKEYISTILWLAFASDFNIKPRISADIYLFDLENHIMLWPYDDRGMDLAGPNKELLLDAYRKFNSYLLDYDRKIMSQYYENKF